MINRIDKVYSGGAFSTIIFADVKALDHIKANTTPKIEARKVVKNL